MCSFTNSDLDICTQKSHSQIAFCLLTFTEGEPVEYFPAQLCILKQINVTDDCQLMFSSPQSDSPGGNEVRSIYQERPVPEQAKGCSVKCRIVD